MTFKTSDQWTTSIILFHRNFRTSARVALLGETPIFFYNYLHILQMCVCSNTKLRMWTYNCKKLQKKIAEEYIMQCIIISRSCWIKPQYENEFIFIFFCKKQNVLVTLLNLVSSDQCTSFLIIDTHIWKITKLKYSNEKNNWQQNLKLIYNRRASENIICKNNIRYQ